MNPLGIKATSPSMIVLFREFKSISGLSRQRVRATARVMQIFADVNVDILTRNRRRWPTFYLAAHDSRAVRARARTSESFGIMN